MFMSVDACQVGGITQWLFNTDVLVSFRFVAIKLNKMMYIMYFLAMQKDNANATSRNIFIFF